MRLCLLYQGIFRMEHVNSTPPARPLLEMKGIAKRFGTFMRYKMWIYPFIVVKSMH